MSVDVGEIKPMYREMMAIDLPTVLRVSQTKSIDIQLARQRVESSRGTYQGAVGAVFPVISGGAAFQHFGGANQNANGTLVQTSFNNILPSATVQWIVNPGRVVYDIIAARRRVEASEQQEQAAELETARAASVQYYDLALAQAQVGVAQQAVAAAEESLRLTHAKVNAGTGLRADELRAKAYLAARRQDLLLAVNSFYQASVALTLTLHLDSTVTLVPHAGEMSRAMLVRDDLSIERLLGIAVEHRPDLQAARTLLAAAKADRKSAMWSVFGPNLQAAYTYGGIATQVNGDTTGLHQQERGTVGAGLTVSPSAFGQTTVATANERTAALDVERRLDVVRAQVVAAQQTSVTNAALIPIAREQYESAEEALRLARANLNAGTMLLVDVLQTQDEFDNARLRYVQAVARYNQSQVNLLASLGVPNAPTATPATQPTAD
jgi:outer membrane protein